MGNSSSKSGALKNAEAVANKLSTQNTELVNQVSALRDTVSTLAATVSQMQAKLERMEKMETQMSAMNNNISSLKETVPSDMESKLDRLKKLDRLDGLDKLEELEAKINQLAAAKPVQAPAPAPAPAPAATPAAVTVDPDILKTVKKIQEIDMARLHNYHRSHKIQWPPSMEVPAELKGGLPKTERDVINLSASQIDALAGALGLPGLPEDESERGATDRHLQVLYYIGVYYHH